MASNFDSLIEELQQRAAERARGSGIVAGEKVTTKSESAHGFGPILAGLRRNAAAAKRMTDRIGNSPMMKAMEAGQQRAAEAARLEAVAAKIVAAVRAGSISAAQASRLELELNEARRRVA